MENIGICICIIYRTYDRTLTHLRYICVVYYCDTYICTAQCAIDPANEPEAFCLQAWQKHIL